MGADRRRRVFQQLDQGCNRLGGLRALRAQLIDGLQAGGLVGRLQGADQLGCTVGSAAQAAAAASANHAHVRATIRFVVFIFPFL